MSLLPALNAKMHQHGLSFVPNDVTVDCGRRTLGPFHLWQCPIPQQHRLPLCRNTCYQLLPQQLRQWLHYQNLDHRRSLLESAIMYPNHYRGRRRQLSTDPPSSGPQWLNLEGCNPNTHPGCNRQTHLVPVECAMIGYSYTDALYTVTPDCKKILRKWTVIDWCQMPSGGYYSNQGSWTFTQTIKIVNSVPPDFQCIPDITVSALIANSAKVIANPLTIDASSCGGNFEITNNPPYSTENTPTSREPTLLVLPKLP